MSALSSGNTDKYEYFAGKEIFPSDQSRMTEHSKFIYSPLEKALQKQTKKQIHALKSINLFNKIDELKQIESVFSNNQLNDSIIDELKEIIQLKNNIKLGNVEYTSKREKTLQIQ